MYVSPRSTGQRLPIFERYVLKVARVSVACAQSKVDAKDGLASTGRSKNKIGRLHVSVQKVP